MALLSKELDDRHRKWDTDEKDLPIFDRFSVQDMAVEIQFSDNSII